MNYGLKLRELRKQRGMRQEDVAEIADVTRETVSYWENGVRSMTLNHAVKAFGALGYRIEIVPDVPIIVRGGENG